MIDELLALAYAVYVWRDVRHAWVNGPRFMRDMIGRYERRERAAVLRIAYRQLQQAYGSVDARQLANLRRIDERLYEELSG